MKFEKLLDTTGRKLKFVHLPDERDVTISRYGLGNDKLGPDVYTYSRLPSKDDGTCPGSTPECEAVCFAKRIGGPVRTIYRKNTDFIEVPRIPDECRLLRIHVSGDFDNVAYILNWIARLQDRPDVRAWAYTRSWRVESLLPTLERLRALSNMQLFASMDASCAELPPQGWRRAWLYRRVETFFPVESRLVSITDRRQVTFDQTPSYVCPEETGDKANCQSCAYCFKGQKHDVTFLEHDGTYDALLYGSK